MKQKLLLSLFAMLMATTAWADVEINATNFADENFRNWVLSQEFGADGLLTESEIAVITELNVRDKYIASLKGVEYFTALTYLQCHRNILTELDVSNNTKLTRLDCYDNQLTKLNVSGCVALTELTCTGNQLTTLDVSSCTELTNLVCYGNCIKGAGMDALVASLPTVSSGSLSVLYYQDEQNVMTKSQVAAAKAKGWTPKWLDINIWAWCEYEGSDDPDPAAGLEINATNFPDANFRGWLLEQEYGADGVLTDEEIAGVQSISVFSKGIQSLQGIEFFTALTSLDCSFNELDSLDVSGCTGLTSLICQVCGLTMLDVSKNTALDRLICTGNQLTSLDVSNHSALTILTCDANQLATLNVSGCPELRTFSLTSNRIKGAGMDSLVESLPMGGGSWMYVIGSSPDEQNVMTKSQVIMAKLKNWFPARWAGYNASGWDIWEDYLGIDEDSIPSTSVAIDTTNFPDANFRNFLLGQTYGADSVLTAEEIAAVSSMRVTNMKIYNLKGIEHFTALTDLSCFQNYLTSLDLSKNTALTRVWCFSNRLTSLNVSGCTALKELDCDENQLARLDVSGCPALTNLYCYKNQIKDSKMDSLVMSLPVVSDGIMNVIFDYGEHNVMTKPQVTAAKAKGWSPRYWDGRTSRWMEYAGSEPEPATLSFVVDTCHYSTLVMQHNIADAFTSPRFVSRPANRKIIWRTNISECPAEGGQPIKVEVDTDPFQVRLLGTDGTGQTNVSIVAYDEYVTTMATLDIAFYADAYQEPDTSTIAFVADVANEEVIVSFGDDNDSITEDTDLTNTEVDGVLFTLNNEEGDGYDATDESIVLNSTMSTAEVETVLEQLKPGTGTFAAMFSGMTFLLPAGSGFFDVEFLTLGDRVLTVKIGNNAALVFTRNEKGSVRINYECEADTYVYIYGSESSGEPAQPAPTAMFAKRAPMRAEANADAVKVYGFTIKPADISPDGIVEINNAQWLMDNGLYYNLAGQRLNKLQRGINILNGKKIIVNNN